MDAAAFRTVLALCSILIAAYHAAAESGTTHQRQDVPPEQLTKRRSMLIGRSCHQRTLAAPTTVPALLLCTASMPTGWAMNLV